MTKMKQFLRLWNTAIDGNLPISKGLLKIRGIGKNLAVIICNELHISKDKKCGMLTDEEVKKIEDLEKNPGAVLPSFVLNRRRDFETGKDELLITANLKLRQEFDVKRMRRIKSFKGIRHATGQPVRGQRTRSHFRKGSAVGVKKPKKVGGKK